MNIKQFFGVTIHKISDVFKKAFGSKAGQAFAAGGLELLKTAAGKLAMDVVRVLETSNPLATPADKRKLAFNQIVADAKTEGISISSSLINLLIEVSVAALKGHIE